MTNNEAFDKNGEEEEPNEFRDIMELTTTGTELSV